jgi:hypothetical protein
MDSRRCGLVEVSESLGVFPERYVLSLSLLLSLPPALHHKVRGFAVSCAPCLDALLGHTQAQKQQSQVTMD